MVALTGFTGCDRDPGPPTLIVDAGLPVAVRQEGGIWVSRADTSGVHFIEGRGAGSYLHGAWRIESGDCRISMTLRLVDVGRGAPGVWMDGKTFTLAGDGALTVSGLSVSEAGRKPPSSIPRDGEWFDLEIERRGSRVVFRVDGDIVSEAEADAVGLDDVALHPDRARLQVRRWEIRGRVSAFDERVGGYPPVQIAVFAAGRGGYAAYRIPALLASSSGTLLAFCEGRKRDLADQGDIDILLARSTDGGLTWSSPTIVHEEGDTASVTIGNPCVTEDRDTGAIWLAFCRNNESVLVTASRDDGISWSPPREITGEVSDPGWTWVATGPGCGVQLQRGSRRGRLVIPCAHADPEPPAEASGAEARESVFRAHVIYSDDHGESWHRGGSSDWGRSESAVVERDDGSLLMNMRNHRRERFRAVAVSIDDGLTWSLSRSDRQLVEPECQAGLVRHSWPSDAHPGRILFSNPASPADRHRLTVRESRDDGERWSRGRVVHPGPAGYSSLAVLGDGRVGLLYEAGEERAGEGIRFARFAIDWLGSGE